MAGGNKLLLVKDNQHTLHEAISQYSDSPPALAGFLRDDWRSARMIDIGHGRRLKVRKLIATTDLTVSSNWPWLTLVFRVERTWSVHG